MNSMYPEGSLWYLKYGMYGKDAKGNRVYIPKGTRIEIVKNHGKDEYNNTVITVQTVEGATIKGNMKILRRRHF